MGNYRQHITFAAALGVSYGWAAFVLAGIHWLYGSVAALLTTLGGLLPDLDSETGVEMRGFTGILGVLVAVAVWQEMEGVQPPPAFEFQLWAVVGAYVLVRHGLRRALSRMARHRGISHSIPTCLVWGAATYLYYPTDRHLLRMMMATAVMLGVLSHLLLDEICSVNLRGVRIKRSFGSAMKLWTSSPWSTLAIYGLLSYLSWRLIQQWPDDPFTLGSPIPAPDVPFPPPRDLALPPLEAPPPR